jgi:hypothetical protein
VVGWRKEASIKGGWLAGRRGCLLAATPSLARKCACHLQEEEVKIKKIAVS